MHVPAPVQRRAAPAGPVGSRPGLPRHVLPRRVKGAVGSPRLGERCGNGGRVSRAGVRTFALKEEREVQESAPAKQGGSTEGAAPEQETSDQVLLPAEPELGDLVLALGIGGVTGGSVVVFNVVIHAIQDLAYKGLEIEGGGALRLLEQSGQLDLGAYLLLVMVPAAGGSVVTILRGLAGGFDGDTPLISEGRPEPSKTKKALRPLLKATAAAVTLGTGNSLGPEGPSVEIGRSVSRAIGKTVKKVSGSVPDSTALLAAGSAAGVAAGFNAAVAGVFFAIETTLARRDMAAKPAVKPGETPQDANVTIVMVLLTAVTAAAVVQAGLGSQPAFRVPYYQLTTPLELPLYALLGLFSGAVAVLFNSSCQLSARAWKAVQRAGVPRSAFPALAGVVTGLAALAYPEVTYQGFANVNDVMNIASGGQSKAAAELAAKLVSEQQSFIDDLFDLVPKDLAKAPNTPFVYGPGLLMQIVAAKVVTTSVAKESGLVGGLFAPSILMGAALGMAYAGAVSSALIPLLNTADGAAGAAPAWLQSLLSDLNILVPQSYGLVGLAAVLSAVCRVPLTAILLLFELTRNYASILPTCAAVGVAYFVTITADAAIRPVAAATVVPRREEGADSDDEREAVRTAEKFAAVAAAAAAGRPHAVATGHVLAEATRDARLSQVTVGDVAAGPVVCVGPGESLEACLARMQAEGASAVVVVEAEAAREMDAAGARMATAGELQAFARGVAARDETGK
ncbi:unnamed protein product [Pedinophyceae sp. YPF-701]|nr:unnamed protein product [Pedinophyceae sp. YPF-701]